MQFDSLSFLIFGIIVLFLYNIFPNWRLQKKILLISSYLFYAAWSPPLIALVWVSTISDYVLAQKIQESGSMQKKKLLLLLSLCINLGLLSYFKYAGFIMENFQVFTTYLGFHFLPPELDLILPIGISFYTFQTISYSIDVFRGKIEASKSFLDFALYVTFFPQLVAGPIVRCAQFLPQCKIRKVSEFDILMKGVSYFIIGIFAKTVLSDSILAPVVDQVFASPLEYGFIDCWLAVFSFSAQIYFDFAGYSLCAIGIALWFGFNLPINFNSPYAASGFSNFWTRWHISLSSWIKDYLYISLGGNRHGRVKTLLNLAITMFLAGLWHGAAWTYVIWGWLHGLFLIIDHLLKKYWPTDKQNFRYIEPLVVLSTFFFVTVAWVPFRAKGIGNLFEMVEALVQIDDRILLPISELTSTLFVITAMIAGHWFSRQKSLDEIIASMRPSAFTILIASLIIAVFLSSTGDTRAFIYFQF